MGGEGGRGWEWEVKGWREGWEEDWEEESSGRVCSLKREEGGKDKE